MIPKSLIEKGTILKISTGVFSSQYYLVISSNDVVTDKGTPGVEVKYFVESRHVIIDEEREHNIPPIPTSSELLINREEGYLLFDISKINTETYETSGQLISGDMVLYDKLLPSEMESIDRIVDSILHGLGTTIGNILQRVISTIPIKFVSADLNFPENSKIYRLDYESIINDKEMLDFISKIDPLFKSNYDYYGIASTEAHALLDLKNNLTSHIAFLKFILSKVDDEWNSFGFKNINHIKDISEEEKTE